eukprot:CFRG8315T1
MPASWQHKLLQIVANQPSNSPIARLLQFCFVFLLFMFADATLQWYKMVEFESGVEKHQSIEFDHYHQMRRFRAQRNSFLTFFALFLLVVLWRFYKLSKDIVNAETMKKQAANANTQLGRMMDEAVAGDKAVKELKAVQEKNEKLQRDLDTLKKQAKQQSEQFERTLDEAQALQEKTGKKTSKKCD